MSADPGYRDNPAVCDHRHARAGLVQTTGAPDHLWSAAAVCHRFACQRKIRRRIEDSTGRKASFVPDERNRP